MKPLQFFACPFCGRRAMRLDTPLELPPRNALMITGKHVGGTDQVVMDAWGVSSEGPPVRFWYAYHTCPAVTDGRKQP